MCFFRQFFTSVNKVDYLTLRHGFITVSFNILCNTMFELLYIYIYIYTKSRKGYKFVLITGAPMLPMWFTFYRHIWHQNVKQNLISKNTLADHLKRILKLWWGSGLCSNNLTLRCLFLWLIFNYITILILLLMRSRIIWFFALLFLLSNTYGKLNSTSWISNCGHNFPF